MAVTGKTMLTKFISYGAESARIVQETARTITVEVVMQRKAYEANVEEHLQPDYHPAANNWAGELRGIERIGEAGPGVQTGGGTYRYTILVFKF